MSPEQSGPVEASGGVGEGGDRVPGTVRTPIPSLHPTVARPTLPSQASTAPTPFSSTRPGALAARVTPSTEPMSQAPEPIRLRVAGPSPRDYSFTQDIVTIGRGADNMVVLADTRVSSIHGRVVRKGEGCVYEDLGSTNGSMVRKRDGRDVVVEAARTGAVGIGPGDMLLLGDVANPVRLDFMPETGDQTMVAGPARLSRRSVQNVDAAGTALVNNPLTSRKVLHELFELFRSLSAERDRAKVVGQLLGFALENLRDCALAAIYRFDPKEGMAHEGLRAKEEFRPKVPGGPVVHELFRAVVSDGMSALMDDAAALQRAFGRGPRPVQSAIVAPLLTDGHVEGIFFVVAPRPFNQFDLDLLTVLAHHGATALENIALLTRLAAAEARLRTENSWLKEVLKREDVGVDIIGESPALKRVIKQVEVVARTDTTVLLLGETGTGKELFARYLHEAGPRRNNIFAAVNCGALAETLLESELFGHKKGAFTGASADRKGLFQVADGGTLFLDEVGDVSPNLQVKLLRVLESGEVTPVGAVRQEFVNVRIVTATNKNLEEEVAQRRFREDLYYRINVFPIRLPPLRERSGDVPLLVETFLARFNRQLEKRITGISQEAMEQLRGYEWPGNVRELQNEIERAVLLTDDGEPIRPEALSERISGMVELPVEVGPLKETMARLEEQYIIRALREHDGNRTHTARTLGISRQALTVKLNRYGIIGND